MASSLPQPAVSETSIIQHIERSNVLMEEVRHRLSGVEKDVKFLSTTFPTLATVSTIKEALVQHTNQCPMPREVTTLSKQLETSSREMTSMFQKARAWWPQSLSGWVQTCAAMLVICSMLYVGATWIGKADASVKASSVSSASQTVDQQQQLNVQLQQLVIELRALRTTHEVKADGSPTSTTHP